jgi:hypothetical protein
VAGRNPPRWSRANAVALRRPDQRRCPAGRHHVLALAHRPGPSGDAQGAVDTIRMAWVSTFPSGYFRRSERLGQTLALLGV